MLIELGGTRAGWRTDEQALAVAEAVAAAPALVLAGVEGFEGTLGADRSDATLGAVDAFWTAMRGLAEALDARGAFAGVDEIVLTRGRQRASSTAWPSGCGRASAARCAWSCEPAATSPTTTACTPGVAAAGLRARARAVGARALCPEPGLAIVGFGKRDAPYDLGLPVVRSHPGVEVTRSTTSTRSSPTRAARCGSATRWSAGSRTRARRSTSGR